LALPPVGVDGADAEPKLVESDTDLAAAATAEELGSASKTTVALKLASRPEHPPLPVADAPALEAGLRPSTTAGV